MTGSLQLRVGKFQLFAVPWREYLIHSDEVIGPTLRVAWGDKRRTWGGARKPAGA